MVLKHDKCHIASSLEDDAGKKVSASVLNELWEQLLFEHGTYWGKVVSDSMYPVIKKGYRVLVEKCSSEKVRFGDIVVFKRNGRLFIHRVLGKYDLAGERYFLEKGDATLFASRIHASDVIGRVCTIKNSAKAVRTTSGRGRILQLVLAFISYSSLRLWVALEYCLTFGRCTAGRLYHIPLYNRFFSILRKIAMLPLK